MAERNFVILSEIDKYPADQADKKIGNFFDVMTIYLEMVWQQTLKERQSWDENSGFKWQRSDKSPS